MKIALIAGEASGDALGAGLMEAVRARAPDVRFEGVAGPRMRAAGCEVLAEAERLAVMGISEVVPRLPELLRLRARLRAHWEQAPPDVLVGIDAPDFNLPLERVLRARGVRTVHYVSPSVWAWRRGRLRAIARAADRVLLLFPFEAAVYREAGIDNRVVGHPHADAIAFDPDPQAARAALGLGGAEEVIAVLPGSRVNEVRRLAADFIETLKICRRARPNLHFVAPMAGAAVRARFEAALAADPQAPPVYVIDAQAVTAMAAADAVLAACGTATLECALLGRPLVSAYRLSALSYWIVRYQTRAQIQYYALPNLLAGRGLVPEYLQDGIDPARMAADLLRYFDDPDAVRELKACFADIHRSLALGADARAAEAVLELAGERA